MTLPSFYDEKLIDLKGKSALVTGASSGIGYSTACFLASVGVNLFLVARRESRLITFQKALKEQYPQSSVNYFAGDLTHFDVIEKIEANGFFNVDILINNAGVALGREPISDGKIAEWEQMVDINIKSAFIMARKVLPYMIENGEGDIVLLSSIAAHIAYEGGGLYCATKHALKAFGTVLRKETCGTNLRVFQMSPGMVETEFSQVRFRGDKEQAKAVYDGIEPLTPDDIARQITWALKQPRHVNLDEIIIMASAQGGVDKVVRNP